jgi:hypothetical protein
VYQPSEADMAGAWERVCAKLLDLGERGHSSTIVVHELGDLASGPRMGPRFAALIRRGANLAGGGHISVVMVTQRPQGIPVLCRSEAQHVVAFTLTDQADRDVAASLLGDIEHPEWSDVVRKRPLPLDRSWWYRGPAFRLELHEPVTPAVPAT